MKRVLIALAFVWCCSRVEIAQKPAETPIVAMPPCAGTVENIRLSAITAGGSVEKFLAAVAAQKAWYAAHHYEDQIFASKILVLNSETNTYSYSETEVLSFHFYSAATVSHEPPHDAGWDAFVKLYKDTSRIEKGTLTCVPAANVPMEM